MGGLVANLTEGLANAAGDQNTVARIQDQRQYERGLNQQELQAKTKQILTGVQALQARRAALAEGDPQLPSIDSALTQHQQALTDLYHPNNNPGALQHLVGFVKQHIGGQTPQPVQSNAVTPERMGQLASSAAGNEPYLTPDELKQKARVAAGLEAKKIMLRPYKESDYLQGLKRYVEIQGGNPDDPEDLAKHEQDYRVQRTEDTTHHRDRFAWSKTPEGRFVNVKLDRDNQPIAGTENYDLLPPSSMTGRISTGQYHFVDDQGNVHSITETRTSTPASANAPGTYQSPQGQSPAQQAAPQAAPQSAAPTSKATVPQTPGQAKQRVAAVAGRDKVIGFKGNKDWTDTNQQYQAAVDRQKTMDLNYQDALKTGSQQAMLSLVANHIGMTLGAQKGARITQSAWNEAMASAPWLDKTASKFFHQDQTGDYVFDGWKSGVTLTPEQMHQMVQLAHEKVGTLGQHIDRLKQQRGAPSGAAPTAPTGPTPTGKAVSLSKARSLPAMQGKTDEQIRQAIIASGHQVIQ